MSNIPYIPETAPFTSEQRAWLNGFLAGLFANGAYPQSSAPSAAAQPAHPLLVLFGSQTGTAEGLARRFAAEAAPHGFAPQVHALNDFPQANFATATTAIIFSSTWGDGDPPDNATNFWAWLSNDSAPRLGHLRFAVLGLGDRNYPEFCGASKKIDARLTELGAARLLPRGECDVDYEPAAKQWIEALWPQLKANTGATGPETAAPAPAANHGASNPPPSSAGMDAAESAKAAASFGKNNPFPARLLANRLLNRPGSGKEVRHYELDLQGSGLAYEAGDALGVLPANCPELVGQIISVLSCGGDQTVSLAGEDMSLAEALTRHLDITKPSQELIAKVAAAAPETEFARLFFTDNPAGLKSWLHGRGIIDLLRLLPEPFPPRELLQLLRKLTPRLYSIASSPKAHPAQVHLTVSSVRYQCYGMARKGVASTFLADRVGDQDVVRLFVQPSHFKPPSHDARMIMVGPGTGIAPFRAFLQDRQAAGASGKNWLFFGDQTRAADFLYESELTSWQKQGLLTRLDLAFSRDQAEKVYVQHRMLEQAAEVWAWLEDGAYFYVCGDAARMAKDVDDCLHNVIQTAGGKTLEQARTFVADLKAQKRYQRDVY